jgi:hypothetical protein
LIFKKYHALSIVGKTKPSVCVTLLASVTIVRVIFSAILCVCKLETMAALVQLLSQQMGRANAQKAAHQEKSTVDTVNRVARRVALQKDSTMEFAVKIRVYVHAPITRLHHALISAI